MTLTKAWTNPLLGRHPTCILKLASELWRELQTWSSREKTIRVKRTLRSIFSGKYKGKESGERAANFCGLFLPLFLLLPLWLRPQLLVIYILCKFIALNEGSHIAPMLYRKKSRNLERPERQAIERSKGEVSTLSLTSRSQPVPVKSPPFYLTWSLNKAPLEFGILASL